MVISKDEEKVLFDRNCKLVVSVKERHQGRGALLEEHSRVLQG